MTGAAEAGGAAIAGAGGGGAGAPALVDAVRRAARHRQALRIAFGMASSFVVALALGWELPFVVAVLVVQFLASMPAAPGVRQVLGVVVLFGAATGSAVVASGLLADMPVPFTLLLGLVFWLAFYLQARRRGGPLAVLLLLSFSLVPVLAVQAPELAAALAYEVVRGGVAAILGAWLMFALVPPPAPAAPGGAPGSAGPPPPEPAAAARLALVHALILLPVLVAALTLTVTGVVLIVLTLSALLGQHSLAHGRRAALGLFLGNVLGGVTAVVAYQVLLAAPTLGVLAALLLLVGLAYAFAVVGAGSKAPVLVTALVTFVIVFGIGVAPLLDEPGASLATRLSYLGLACAYALVALTLTEDHGPSRGVVPVSDAR